MKTEFMTLHSECHVKKAGFQTQPVPMGLLNEEWAQKGHGQTLEGLNRRGGLTVCEMLAIICRRPYRTMEPHEANVRLHDLITGYNIAKQQL